MKARFSVNNFYYFFPFPSPPPNLAIFMGAFDKKVKILKVPQSVERASYTTVVYSIEDSSLFLLMLNQDRYIA
jgi:hypothetical protein